MALSRPLPNPTIICTDDRTLPFSMGTVEPLRELTDPAAGPVASGEALAATQSVAAEFRYLRPGLAVSLAAVAAKPRLADLCKFPA